MRDWIEVGDANSEEGKPPVLARLWLIWQRAGRVAGRGQGGLTRG